MSILILKIISFITMIIDHTGIVFFPSNEIFRIIGMYKSKTVDYVFLDF